MADPAIPLTVIIDDDDNSVRVDPQTGAVEIDQPDGGVVVNFDAHKGAVEKDEDDEWFANLADQMDPMELARIASELIEAITADDQSRSGYLANRDRGLDILGLQLKEPRSSPADASSGEGMSSVTNPLLLEAVLKGWANAQAELLPAAGPAKIRDDGDESAVQDDLAESFERDLNHWFTTTAAEFYPDTSHMLLWGVYFGGSGFKKVYRCPMRRRPVSESVDAKDLIVSDTTKDLRSCGRITHQIPMRPSVMKRMILIEAYRDVPLTQPTPTPNQVDEKIGQIQGTTRPTRPEDQPYTIWESQCELDLDDFIPAGSKFKGEGIPLPYLVTLEKDSQTTLAIRRDWDRADAECERRRMYVKYPYVPGPGFYGTGMVNILGNSSAAMTAAWREALDAGMYASFPGGLMTKIAGRQNSATFRPAPGEFVPIETNGMRIQDAVMGMPQKDVTAGLLALMDKVTEQSKQVSGAPEMPVGEGLQNVPVGTMLTAVEQATKIMAAAHKGMHTAMSEEIQLIVELFRENPEDFWRSNKVCQKGYWNETKFLRALDECQNRLVPVSDPNVPSHLHRVAKALALVTISAMPQFMPRLDPDELLRRVLAAIREEPRGLVVTPPPQQPQASPADMAKVIDANAKATDAQTRALKLQFDSGAAARKDEVKLAEMQAKERIADVDLQREMIIHAHDGERRAQASALDAAAAAQDADMRQREHALDVAEHVHRVGVDQRKLDIEQLKATNPPRPKKPAK